MTAAAGRPPSILATYPRCRPDLSARVHDIHLQTLLHSREGQGFATWAGQRLEAWMHRRVASAGRGGPLLEVGAGILNHVAYERPDAPYDVVEPEPEFFRGKEACARIRHFYTDISEVPATSRYGRIISIAALEHVLDLPRLVARSGLLLEPNGLFQAGIPSEGGFLWALSWRVGRDIPFRLRHRLDYGELMRHEHVSSATDIIAVIRAFFRKVAIRWYGPGFHLSLYGYIEASDPDINLCRHWLDGAATARKNPAETGQSAAAAESADPAAP